MSSEIEGLCQLTGIPRKVFRYLQQQGYMGEVLDQDDYFFVQAVRALWGDRFLLRCMLSQFNRQDRRALVETASLSQKWERYAYSCFRNHYIKNWGKKKSIGRRIEIAQIASDIHSNYKVKVTKSMIPRLKNIRAQAYMQVKRDFEKQ